MTCINLSAEKEPQIYIAIHFGSILKNVYNPANCMPDYNDVNITKNMWCMYLIKFIPNACILCIINCQPSNIMLTCNMFGVLPPISAPEQASYHFLAGYTL
jgi:phosphoenolpyruvate carboxykinase (ATP)